MKFLQNSAKEFGFDIANLMSASIASLNSVKISNKNEIKGPKFENNSKANWVKESSMGNLESSFTKSMVLNLKSKSWDDEWPEYDPIQYTSQKVLLDPAADPDLMAL